MEEPACDVGTFLWHGVFSVNYNSYGCRCCTATDYVPHRIWSVYRASVESEAHCPKLAPPPPLPPAPPGTAWPRAPAPPTSSPEVHVCATSASAQRCVSNMNLGRFNSPQACAAEVVSKSGCDLGTFLWHNVNSVRYGSWGCRCCTATDYVPHRIWSVYRANADSEKNCPHSLPPPPMPPAPVPAMDVRRGPPEQPAGGPRPPARPRSLRCEDAAGADGVH